MEDIIIHVQIVLDYGIYAVSHACFLLHNCVVSAAVKSIAFVTPDDSSNLFMELESVLLECHGCDRLQPVAPSDDQPLTLSDHHLRICQWLKEKECLVYIMWPGSLEDMQAGTFIKDIVNLLSSRPPLDTSVMHRLIFLQLGSKGSVDCSTSPHKSTWVYWEFSPMDGRFDAKECGESVSRSVRTKLEDLSQEVMSRTELTIGVEAAYDGMKVGGQDGRFNTPKPPLLDPSTVSEERIAEIFRRGNQDVIASVRDQFHLQNKFIDKGNNEIIDVIVDGRLADQQLDDQEQIEDPS